jgi:hypothetical protein
MVPAALFSGVKLTTHLHLVPRLRMCGAIPSLTHTSYVFTAWCSVKYSDNFFFFSWEQPKNFGSRVTNSAVLHPWRRCAFLPLTLYLYKTSSLEPKCCNLSTGLFFSSKLPPLLLACPREQPSYAFTFHLSEACRDFPVTPSAASLWSADKSPVVQPLLPFVLPHQPSTDSQSSFDISPHIITPCNRFSIIHFRGFATIFLFLYVGVKFGVSKGRTYIEDAIAQAAYWTIGVRFPPGAGKFSLHHRVQNGSGAYPASYPVSNKSSFPEGNAAGAWSWPLVSI